jgi:hypothetical protein
VLSRPEITATANTFRKNTGATNAEYVLPNTSTPALLESGKPLLRTINRRKSGKRATIGSRLSKWNFSTSHPPPSFFFKIPSFDWIVA